MLRSITEIEDEPAMIDSPSIHLEREDIQSGALHERPSPYFGTYLLMRIDNPARGRELLRRLLPVVESSQSMTEHDSGS